jgi:hypothetical protein
VSPAQWRLDLDNPLHAQPEHDDEEGGPVLKRTPPDDREVAWHFCGIGTKD